jgi:hypothetical protein
MPFLTLVANVKNELSLFSVRHPLGDFASWRHCVSSSGLYSLGITGKIMRDG